MNSDREVAFVAYAASDPVIADIISNAVRKVNAFTSPIRYEPWIFNDVPGTPLLSPILEKIDESAFVVADITVLNLNVVYEIGYAIGRQKRVFLIRHKSTSGDKALANKVGIFDTLGYFEYLDEGTLVDRLNSHIDPNCLSIAQGLDRKAPVYTVDPPHSDGIATTITSRIKKAGYRYRSFSSIEDVRLSATDAIRQVAVSSGVVLQLQSVSIPDSVVHNIRAMFVAGLAEGMGKPLLLMASPEYVAPLDVRDSVRRFRHPHDIRDLISEFCPTINNHSQEIEPSRPVVEGRLSSLAIGDPIAENEMATLDNYYLRTNEYQRALRGEANLVVGRKGSGKTALFIQVRDRIRSDKRNIVVDLKPEGYQLIRLKEDILEYLTEGTRQHLVTAFWEYLILLEVAYKLLEKDRNTYKFNHELRELYIELEATYKTEDFSVEGDFSERLLVLSQRLAQKYQQQFGETKDRKLNVEDVTRLLYAHNLRELKSRISTYLEKKQSVWILFDNLDKGWSTLGVDVIDAAVLRSLIDAGRKVEREMGKIGHVFHCIIFVRNDVYEHLMQNSADYGKEMRVTLDWTDPDLLREMLRLRLVSGLGSAFTETAFEDLWPTMCDLQVKGEESASYMLGRSLMRPRNLLKIFNHSRGFAANFNHARITEKDVEKGLKAYSQDLLIELDRELSDVFPQARELLYQFIDCQSEISPAGLNRLLTNAKVDESEFSKIIEFFLYYGILGIRTEETDLFIYDVHYDLKPLKIRAERAKEHARFVINPAFWPALSVVEVMHGQPKEFVGPAAGTPL